MSSHQGAIEVHASAIFVLIATALSSFILFFQLTPLLYFSAFLLFIAIVFFLGRRNLNIMHLCGILIALTVVEQAIFSVVDHFVPDQYPAVWVNGVIYSFHAVIDFTILYLCRNRLRLSRRWLKSLESPLQDRLYLTHADILLVGVYALFILVDLAALGENFIRNMEFLGVDETFAKQFWSWSFVYHNYPLLKSILSACVIVVLLATVFVERAREDEDLPEEIESEAL